MLIILGLGILWAAVLLPPLLRRDAPVVGSAGNLAVIGRPDAHTLRALQQAAAAVPGDALAARHRRRDVLIALGGVAGFTLLGAVAVGGALWTIHFLVDLVLAGYAVLLTSRYQRENERSSTVVPFRRSAGYLVGGTGSVAMSDEAVLRRQAN